MRRGVRAGAGAGRRPGHAGRRRPRLQRAAGLESQERVRLPAAPGALRDAGQRAAPSALAGDRRGRAGPGQPAAGRERVADRRRHGLRGGRDGHPLDRRHPAPASDDGALAGARSCDVGRALPGRGDRARQDRRRVRAVRPPPRGPWGAVRALRRAPRGRAEGRRSSDGAAPGRGRRRPARDRRLRHRARAAAIGRLAPGRPLDPRRARRHPHPPRGRQGPPRRGREPADGRALHRARADLRHRGRHRPRRPAPARLGHPAGGERPLPHRAPDSRSGRCT